MHIRDLREIHRTLAAPPPKVVRLTAFLLVAMLASAVVWAGVSQADLVVKAPARVRPIT